MGNRYYIYLNYFLYFIFTILIAVIQSVFLNKFIFFAPMLFLTLIIYFGKTRKFFEGVIYSFLIGYIFHLNSSVNEVISNFYFVFVFILAKYLSSIFSLRKLLNNIYFIFTCSMFYFALVACWNSYYTSASILKILYSGFLSSIILSLVGIYFFNLYKLIDTKTGLKVEVSVEEYKGKNNSGIFKQ